jgi:hypothetical protein
MPGPVSLTERLYEPSPRTPDRHFPLIGELDRVADEIEQNLGDAALIAAAGQQILGHLDLERNPFFRGERFHPAEHLCVPETQILARILPEARSAAGSRPTGSSGKPRKSLPFA